MSETRRWSTQATAGLILLVVGVVAAAALLGLSIPSGAPLHPGGSSAPAAPITAGSSTTTVSDVLLGEIIYTYGTDASGNLIPRSGFRGMMGMRGSAVACASCHGPDARGRTVQVMMSRVEVPDIRWSTLSAPPADPTEEAFDPDSFFRAVTQGIEPEGGTLKAPMPRWGLTRAESDALIEYLKAR